MHQRQKHQQDILKIMLRTNGLSGKISILKLSGSVNMGRLGKSVGHFMMAAQIAFMDRLREMISLSKRGLIQMGKLELVVVPETK